MPELPDIIVYLEALDVRITGRPLEAQSRREKRDWRRSTFRTELCC
jgi:hypothetical protein